MSDDRSDADDDDDMVTCWCGATGRVADLFDQDAFRRTCGGIRTLYCRCGGDQCMCHHHGEVECPGCDDCECDDDGADDWDAEELPDHDIGGEGVAQPQWRELPETAAGDQDRSGGPRTAPAVFPGERHRASPAADDFGAGVFEER